MVVLGSLFLTLPQLVNTKFSTANFMNENDEIKEHRYCRVAWEEEKIPITTRNLEMTKLYGTQFGFNRLSISQLQLRFFLLDARTFFWHFSAMTRVTEISLTI